MIKIKHFFNSSSLNNFFKDRIVSLRSTLDCNQTFFMCRATVTLLSTGFVSLQMKRVSLDPSKRQAQLKTLLEKPQKPTLKPKPAIEAEKPSASPEKVELLFLFFFSDSKTKEQLV